MTHRHYSEAISRELTRRYEQMRQRAQLLAEQNRDKVYHNHPELRELRNRLQSAQWARTKQRCLSMVDNKDSQSAVVKPLDSSLLLSDPQAMQDDPDKIRQQICNYLDQHHIPRDFDHPQYSCFLCEDTGTRSDGQDCSCRRHHLKIIQKQRNLMLPPEQNCFANHLPELFSDQCDPNCYGGKISQREVVALARSQAENYTAIFSDETEYSAQKNIYICGPTGTGKSFLLGAIGNELLEQGFTVVHISAAELSTFFQQRQRIQKEFNPDEAEVNRLESLLDEFTCCEFLSIDDLGAEAPDSSFTNHLSWLLDQREQRGNNTGVSSNLLPSDLQRYYGERLSSRLVNTATVIILDGEDVRQRAVDTRLLQTRGFR